MAASNWMVLFSVLFCFALHSIGGGAPRSAQGSRSPLGTWPMMANKNASGNSLIKPMEYFPGSNAVVHLALFRSNKAEYYGARAVFTVHPLRDVQEGQESSVVLSMANTEMDFIGAGWHVRPDLYGDNEVHFFTFWTADYYHNTGCFNLKCPGFVVQEGSRIVPGSILASVRQITISIRKVGDWRLYVDDGLIAAEVGRWPMTLFTRLNDHAESIVFGGRAEFSKGDGGPPMGSGHFPGDVAASASIKKLQLVDYQGSFRDFKLGDQMIQADARECYDAILTPHTTSDSGNADLDFFYGGPSGCKNYS